MPVKTTAATVMETMPPSCSETPMAMGVVTDLGRRETVTFSSSLKSRQRSQTLPMEAAEPAAEPAKMGKRFFFRRSIWL